MRAAPGSGPVAVTTPSGEPASDEALRSRIIDYLARYEAVNCIQLSTLLAYASFDPEVLVLVAYAGADIAGVLTRHPGLQPVLSHVEHQEAAPALARTLPAQDVPGVMGPSEAALAFANEWSDRHEVRFEPRMSQRILAANSVVPPRGVEGNWRLGDGADHALLRAWFAAFAVEVEGVPASEAAGHADAMLRRLDSRSGIVTWEDAGGVPVSVACYKAPTLTGIRIGPVYTPPEHRRRGYAGAVTAAATRLLLDRGRAFVCLYTNAENQTANHVYEAIGYQHVANSMLYRFIPAGEREVDS